MASRPDPRHSPCGRIACGSRPLATDCCPPNAAAPPILAAASNMCSARRGATCSCSTRMSTHRSRAARAPASPSRRKTPSCSPASPELSAGSDALYVDTRRERSSAMERMKASDFPPGVLKLFDGYVHGFIDRRAFLDRAAKFALGGMTAAVMLESLRPNYALAQ